MLGPRCKGTPDSLPDPGCGVCGETTWLVLAELGTELLRISRPGEFRYALDSRIDPSNPGGGCFRPMAENVVTSQVTTASWPKVDIQEIEANPLSFLKKLHVKYANHLFLRWFDVSIKANTQPV